MKVVRAFCKTTARTVGTEPDPPEDGENGLVSTMEGRPPCRPREFCKRLVRLTLKRRLHAVRRFRPLLAGLVLIAGGPLVGCRGPERLPFRPQPGDLVSYVPVAGRVVALTFDDGPNDPYTSQVLDVLDRESVRATFFLVGTNAERNPDTVRRMVQAGHAIGNHSYDHPRFDQISYAARRDEIRHGADAIAAVTGVRPVLFRIGRAHV